MLGHYSPGQRDDRRAGWQKTGRLCSLDEMGQREECDAPSATIDEDTGADRREQSTGKKRR